MFKNSRSIYFTSAVKWLSLCLIISSVIGSAAALFLITLNEATSYREANPKIIYFLPIVGFLIALAYKHFGKSIAGGNNLLFENILDPKKTIPLKMAPMVYLGTILTHLFGGSAGREGTALQMAGSLADQFSNPFKLTRAERCVLLMAALAGGFSAVFGTPLTGFFFAMELLLISRINLKAAIPALVTAYLSDAVCRFWNVPHTHYHINNFPSWNLSNMAMLLIAGLAFGLCARLFSQAIHGLSAGFKKITFEPFRTLLGGLLILLLVYFLGTTKFIGLGIPVIVDSFENQAHVYDFLLKIAFTIITLAAGFKGGEVTPLFFIGATLGSALSFYLPLPVSLMAGLGFVAVFAGATNTPIACAIMAVELFGLQSFPYALLTCFVSYLSSGNLSIYTSQIIRGKKHLRYSRLISGRFKNL